MRTNKLFWRINYNIMRNNDAELARAIEHIA